MTGLEKVLNKLKEEIEYYNHAPLKIKSDPTLIEKIEAKLSTLEDIEVYVKRLIKEHKTNSVIDNEAGFQGQNMGDGMSGFRG